MIFLFHKEYCYQLVDVVVVVIITIIIVIIIIIVDSCHRPFLSRYFS